MKQLTAVTLSGQDSNSDSSAIYQVSMKTTGDSKDEDYDDVWDSDTPSDHLLKLQTELDVLTSRARLVQCDRHCRRPRTYKRRIIEDYEEKWWEEFNSKENSSDTCKDTEESRVAPGPTSCTDYSVPPDNEDSDYSEIPDYSEVHDHRQSTEDEKQRSQVYSEPYDSGNLSRTTQRREVLATPPRLPARREQPIHPVKKPVWDLKKLKRLYKGSIKKSTKLLPKTLCPSKEDYSKSDCLLGLLGLKP